MAGIATCETMKMTLFSLRDQRHRVDQHEPAQGHQKQSLIPDRRCENEALLSGTEQHQQEVDNANQGLGGSLEQVQYPVRRQAFAELPATPFIQNSVPPPLALKRNTDCGIMNDFSI